MADIDQIIAGGAGASTRADFSKLGSLWDSLYKAQDQAYQQEGRNLFKDGLPQKNGELDYGAIRDALLQHGDVGQGVAVDNLGIQRDQLKLGQQASQYMGGAEGGGSSPIVSPPSSNRNAYTSVAPALGKGGAAPQATPQQGGTTIMQVLTAQGIPNDQLGAAGASVARQLGVDDPNAPVDMSNPQVRNVLIPAVAQLKRLGIGQVVGPQQAPGVQGPQVGPQPVQAPPQAGPQVPAPVMAQSVNPQQSQGTFGAPPATPTRGAVPTGNDPEIQKQIATYTYIASNPAYPKPVQEAALTRLRALQDQGQPTGPMKEYDLYRRQGGDMSFRDFAADLESGKSGATERAKAEVKEQQDYISQGRMAQQRLGTLNTISNIVSSDKNLDLGFGSETTLKVKMALEKAGIDFGDLSGSQMIQKLNGVLASESSKSFSTRPTQFEFKTFLANNPGLALDEKGNVRMLGILSQTAKRDADLGKLARQNQDNWSKWDDVVEKYDQDHPIKDPTTGKVLSNHSIIAPAPKTSTASASPPMANAKKAPDGNWYVPDPGRQGKYLKVVQ